MKYYFLEIKNLFKNKILKYFIIELAIFIYYGIMLKKANESPFPMLFGINTISISNPFESVLRLINSSVIIFSTYTIYFFDLFRSAEFTLLREEGKSYFLKHLVIIILFNIVTILVFAVLFMILFGHVNLDLLFVGLKGIINIIYISLLAINIINTLSYKNYFLLFVSTALLFLNLFFLSKYMILELLGIVLILVYNIFRFKPQKVYDRFFRN